MVIYMINNYEKAKAIVKKYNQEHLLSFYEDLDTDEKNFLVNQICSINFEQIFNLYENSKKDEVIPHNLIEPLPYKIKNDLSNKETLNYEEVGLNKILENKYAVVTLAGGQGTRLGYKGPKGTFELDIIPKKSLFEILCDNLKDFKHKYNITIPWYIMTSIYNDKETKDFFEKKNYFDYPKDSIKFFTQSQLPLIDTSREFVIRRNL